MAILAQCLADGGLSLSFEKPRLQRGLIVDKSIKIFSTERLGRKFEDHTDLKKNSNLPRTRAGRSASKLQEDRF
jgi:hypothetical protein